MKKSEVKKASKLTPTNAANYLLRLAREESANKIVVDDFKVYALEQGALAIHEHEEQLQKQRDYAASRKLSSKKEPTP